MSRIGTLPAPSPHGSPNLEAWPEILKYLTDVNKSLQRPREVNKEIWGAHQDHVRRGSFIAGNGSRRDRTRRWISSESQSTNSEDARLVRAENEAQEDIFVPILDVMVDELHNLQEKGWIDQDTYSNLWHQISTTAREMGMMWHEHKVWD